MVKVGNFVNVEIQNAMSIKAEPLTDDEYKLIEKIMNTPGLDITKTHPLHPEGANIQEYIVKKLMENKKSAVEIKKMVDDCVKDMGGLIEKDGALLIIAKENKIEYPKEDKSQVIIAKIPDNAPPKKKKAKKTGEEFYSVSFVMGDGTWGSFITRDKDEVTEIEAHLGSVIAIVGILKPREYEKTQLDGTKIKAKANNVDKYRGCMIFPSNNLDVDTDLDLGDANLDLK